MKKGIFASFLMIILVFMSFSVIACSSDGERVSYKEFMNREVYEEGYFKYLLYSGVNAKPAEGKEIKAAIVSYIPVGLLASKMGRKKTVLIGVALLFTAFLTAAFMRKGSSPIIMYTLFALAGIGWATINVNSFPMVVELAKSSDTGRYTGFYYTASMAAQTLTPVLSGVIMDAAGNMLPLFFYAAAMVGGSFLTMLFVRHGDSKPEKLQNKIEAFADND